MEIRRLGWAGIELVSGESRIVIDAFEDNSPLEPFTGEPHTDLPAATPDAADGALVTHMHSDHADGGAIGRALKGEGPVLRPAPAEGEGLETIALASSEAIFAELGLEQIHLEPWESREIGAFTATAVPAVDGFGDPQVSWVVEADGTRIFHGGDTVFHGYWWPIAMRTGPIDIAFLPINGARCDFPHRQPPSPLPAVLDPEQAAAAAHLLGAGRVVPIHYDSIHGPPVYAQVDNPAERFAAAADDLGVDYEIAGPGEQVASLAG